jgi:hypothetical protein
LESHHHGEEGSLCAHGRIASTFMVQQGEFPVRRLVLSRGESCWDLGRLEQ